MQNGNQGTFMDHNEGVAWDRCRFHRACKQPSNADFDRVMAVKARAKGGPIFYKSGLAVANDE